MNASFVVYQAIQLPSRSVIFKVNATSYYPIEMTFIVHLDFFPPIKTPYHEHLETSRDSIVKPFDWEPKIGF